MGKIKFGQITLIVLTSGLVNSAFGVKRPSAREILAKADDIRMPQGEYRVVTRVVSSKPNRTDQEATYEVLLKGRDKTLVKTLAPATDRGTSMLMIGRDLWIFLQNVSKPLRVSLQQRLLGDVANGDLARANFSGDYLPTIESARPNFYRLRLKANSDDVTYGSVQLWVDRKTFRPLRARFFSASGKVLKVGSYENYKMMAGAMHPSRLVFVDAITKGQKSVIYYDRLEKQSGLPDKLFTKDYLKKLKY
jgi:outer membrane lipoprotein-sorting protein